MPRPRITLEQYRSVYADHFEYILDTIPATVTMKVVGWKCLGCGTIREQSYDEIKTSARRKVPGCPKCSGKVTKTLADYQQEARDHGGFAYVLDHIPKDTNTAILGWQCLRCAELRSMPFGNVHMRQGCGGRNCYDRIKKILEDYQQLGQQHGLTYILDHIPPLASLNILGWKCRGCGQLRNLSYTTIGMGHGCAKCAGNEKKTLADYQALGHTKGTFTYVLSTIPTNTHTSILGWKCCGCGELCDVKYDSVNAGRAGCNHCNESSGERQVSSCLRRLGIPYEREWKLTGHTSRWDFYLPIQRAVIEMDGSQHFKPCNKFKLSLEETQARDQVKNDLLFKERISLLRIADSDWDMPDLEAAILTFMNELQHFKHNYRFTPGTCPGAALSYAKEIVRLQAEHGTDLYLPLKAC